MIEGITAKRVGVGCRLGWGLRPGGRLSDQGHKWMSDRGWDGRRRGVGGGGGRDGGEYDGGYHCYTGGGGGKDRGGWNMMEGIIAIRVMGWGEGV